MINKSGFWWGVIDFTFLHFTDNFIAPALNVQFPFYRRLVDVFGKGAVVTYRVSKGLGWMAEHSSAYFVWDVVCFLGVALTFREVAEAHTPYYYSDDLSEGIRKQQEIIGAVSNEKLESIMGRTKNNSPLSRPYWWTGRWVFGLLFGIVVTAIGVAIIFSR